MKTLSTLAVLSLAAAAQAFTIDANIGAASPSTYDSNAVWGLGIGTQLNNDFHLGLNFSSLKLYRPNDVDATARSTTLDLTYELNGTGNIRPFIGAGLGVTHFTSVPGTPRADMYTESTLVTNLFAGVAFRVTDTVDLLLTARNTEMFNVQELQNGPKKSINSWQSSAGLRFKF